MPNYAERGQSLISLTLLIGGMLATAGIALAFIIFSQLGAVYSYRAFEAADVAANAGVEDALLQLDRNILFTSSGYSVQVGSSTATVTVTQSSTNSAYDTIVSIATVSNSTRKIQAVVLTSSSTGQVVVVQEAPTQ